MQKFYPFLSIFITFYPIPISIQFQIKSRFRISNYHWVLCFLRPKHLKLRKIIDWISDNLLLRLKNLIYFQVCCEYLKLYFNAPKLIDIYQPLEMTVYIILAVMEHFSCRPSMYANIFQPYVLKTTGHWVNNVPGRIIEWERKRESWESKSVKESNREKGDGEQALGGRLDYK